MPISYSMFDVKGHVYLDGGHKPGGSTVFFSHILMYNFRLSEFLLVSFILTDDCLVNVFEE